jgi:Transglutaminase-like superfamily.
LGIPTRVATGMVYTGSQWQRHAWAESLVGDVWVPVDPTFSEVGMVNALHIKLYHAPTYLFYQFPQSLENIYIADYEIDDYPIPLVVEAELSHEKVPPKGTFFLTANITNQGNTVIIPTYSAQKTVGIELLSDFRQSAIMAAGESKTLQWKFTAPFGERETYYIFLVGPRADERYAIVVDPLLSAEGYTDFELKNVYASVAEENIRIEAEVKNIGSSDYARVVATATTDLGTQQPVFSLVSGDTKIIEFLFPC